MNLKTGKYNYITLAYLNNNNLINGGNLTKLTYLQKICIKIINDEILKFKSDNKPFITI